MAEVLNILIVENDDQDIQNYQDIIKTINYEQDKIKIDAHIEKTKEGGLGALSAKNWDAAFIDLKLSTGNILHAREGNDIVEEIYKKRRFPIFILSNTPEDVSRDFEPSLFLRVNSKDGLDYHSVFQEIISIHNTGILKILGKRGRIESILDDIFWKNISNTLKEWIPIENSEKALLRYTLTHILEHLEISDDGSEFDVVHPIENYIKPSIKNYFFTGNIVFLKNDPKRRYIIINPACDMAPHGKEKMPKAAFINLVELQDFSNTPISSAVKKIKKGENAEIVENNKTAVIKFITNNNSPQYYYLPDTTIIKGGLINFQRLSSIKYSELENYDKEATITSQFMKDIIAKFSFFYSRQGSPDFNFENLLEEHLR